ncbi:MAG: hypothetical protein HYY01_07710 [Chloroflexi bacterium]|nr:hypothetical protein [Chloroflexota bacterium]
MNSYPVTLKQSYSSALQAYLADAQEAALMRAYELGRQATENGLGVLDIAAVHQEALTQVLRPSSPSQETLQTVQAASKFLAECIAPFEMTHRGFREANAALKQQATQLANLNKELDAFAYSVSHDLRAPLRAIDGFSQALLEDYLDKLDAQGVDYLNRVRNASQAMGRLIDGLLKLSRLTRAEMRRQPVDLSATAQAIAEALRKSQPERRVAFSIAGGVTANGDPVLLQVVLENLLSNAWKFTSRHATATIEFGATWQDGKQVCFVRDDGAGFEMAYAGKLFGAFQRLHGRNDFEGTGIGLATVRRIIDQHGGRVWAEGAVDRGAAFYFTLEP